MDYRVLNHVGHFSISATLFLLDFRPVRRFSSPDIGGGDFLSSKLELLAMFDDVFASVSAIAFEKPRIGDSQVLIQIMKEAYPHLEPTRKSRTAAHDEYHKKLGVLKDRLHSGWNWELANA